MRTIDRAELDQLMRNSPDLVLIEVLGTEAFHEWHLPGAISVPLDHDFNRNVERLLPDTERLVCVYAADAHAPVGRNAANRLDEMGYSRVFWYAGGKADWQAAGERVERGVLWGQHRAPNEENRATRGVPPHGGAAKRAS